MSEEIIELTPRELDEIKDDAVFKVLTTKTLKKLCKKMDDVKIMSKTVDNLVVHKNYHWFFIALIFGCLVKLAFFK